ncbi:LCP family protein [Tessaracoccus sp. Z1128]
MTEDGQARRAASGDGGAGRGKAPKSAATPTRALEDTPLDDWDSPADLPFPHNVRLRMAAQERAAKGSLRRASLLTLASTMLPGIGLLGARRPGLRVAGLVAGGSALGAGAFIAYYAVANTTRLATLAVSPGFLTGATLALIVVGLVWVTLIVVTHLATRPRGLSDTRRALGAILVVVLAFAVATPTAIAARYARDQMLLVDRVFTSGDDEVKSSTRPTLDSEGGADPFADIPRINILLLGADGSANRADAVEQFSIRTDTIILASIDTQSGATTLIQIPRNVQYTPFPEGSEMAEAFPDGFRGEPAEDWLINSVWAHTELGYPDLFDGATYRGAEALKQGVEGITGLKVDYFAMLNIDGIQQLIDAMGGVTVNINQRLAIGGNSEGRRPSGYLEPGPDQHLMGYEAMWYARSRLDYSDYDRMARQSCLVGAIIKQANPATLLTRYEAIAAASSQMVVTDIPQRDLPEIVELALRVKDGQVSRLVYSPGKNGYSYENPDFEAMQAAVEQALDPPSPTTSAAPGVEPTAAATPSATTTSPSAEPSPSASESPVLTDGAQNVTDACAWYGEEG